MKIEFNYTTIAVIIVILVALTPVGRAFVESLTSQAVGEPYYGSTQFKVIQSDYFSGAGVSPTSAVYTLFHGRPGAGVAGTAITASGTTTEIFKADDGIVYMAMYFGTDYYLVEADFWASNPRIREHYYEDFDTDGVEELVVKLYVGDVGERGQGLTPVVSLSAPLLDEDVASYADDNPTDIGSIGTSKVTTPVTWKISGITAEDGAVLARLYFTTNASRGGDDLRFKGLSMSGGWTINGQTAWANPIHEENGNYEAWYIKNANYLEPYAGIMVWRGTNDADTLYITVNVECTFESAEDHLVDIYAEFIDPDGATITQVNDQVKLST